MKRLLSKYDNHKYRVKKFDYNGNLVFDRYVTLKEAGAHRNDGWATVSIDDQVLKPDGGFRQITKEENQIIQDIADDMDVMK